MFDLSVIICSHNPRTNLLRRTLDSLQTQKLELEKWELLLIDNASTAPLDQVWDLSWHPHGRHVRESELGLSSARLRGMKESASDLLVFVDDDNVLDQSYLLEVRRMKSVWPWLGVWGSGATIPEFEVQPAEDLRGLTPYLALRDVKKASWSNVYPCKEATPWGAGLCVRASVADKYRRINDNSRKLISDRRGKNLMSGGDVEICYAACSIGLGMGVFPELKLTHLIPKERLSRKYLLDLVEGTVTSDILLAYRWKGILPESPLRLRGLLSFIKNGIMGRGLDREIYLAHVRALTTARRIIKTTRPHKAE